MLKEKPLVLVHGDGVTDDHNAIEAHYNGKARAVHADGTPFPKPGARYFTSKTIVVGCKFEPVDTGILMSPNATAKGSETA